MIGRGALISLGFVLLGATLAALVARVRARQQGLDVQHAIDGLFVVLLAGVLVSHVSGAPLFRWSEVVRDPVLLLPGSGAAWSLGAIVGAAGAGWLYFSRRAPGALWQHADNLVLALCLGWGVGRIGCFLHHDHLGQLTSFPLGVRVAGALRHDLGLYEAVLALGLFALLWTLQRRRRAPGVLVGVAALVYGAGRFGIELLRATDLELLGRRSDARYRGLTLVAHACVLLCACGLVLLRWQARSATAVRC